MRDHLQELYESLNKRYRPEDVAQLIAEQLEGQLSPKQIAMLNKAAKNSLKHQVYHYTSMLQDFAQPVGAQKQVIKAQELFKSAQGVSLSAEECSDPEAVEKFILQISPEIAKFFGHNDFKQDRLNHQARLEVGLDLSRRRYNKLFRHLTRLETKLLKLTSELKKLKIQKIGKSGLASELSWEQFASDLNSACFIAYYTARSNLRSQFTIDGQTRAFDEIAEMLFKRCDENANWWAIAHVFPQHKVLTYLSDEQKGELLGRWFNLLQEIGNSLATLWDKSNINRATMVVKRGNDSTTWNNTASAWNKARDNWMGLVYALGCDNMLDSLCFGKVLRLMAADVVYWHRRMGGDLDANTLVWNSLPLPWEVSAGEKICTRTNIKRVCQEYEIDPEKSGWIAPRPDVKAVEFRPTPELVHGVTVASPYLATLLKKLFR